MEKSVYLLYGTEEDRKNTSMVLSSVADAINCMLKVADSYGVEFSQDVVNRLYKELDDHVKKMKG